MVQVGYKLIDTSTNAVLQSWGGVWGTCPSQPSEIRCPNGDIVCGPALDVEYSGCMLVAWNMDEPAPSIPQEVPMWAVRTVLQNDNLFDQAQTAIDASTDNALKNVWEYGNYATRSSKAIASLAATLNLTDAQIDQMFIDADNLEV